MSSLLTIAHVRSLEELFTDLLLACTFQFSFFLHSPHASVADARGYFPYWDSISGPPSLGQNAGLDFRVSSAKYFPGSCLCISMTDISTMTSVTGNIILLQVYIPWKPDIFINNLNSLLSKSPNSSCHCNTYHKKREYNKWEDWVWNTIDLL